jgi:hypothetical protein
VGFHDESSFESDFAKLKIGYEILTEEGKERRDRRQDEQRGE